MAALAKATALQGPPVPALLDPMDGEGYILARMAGVAQLVERRLVVPNVAGSSPVARPIPLNPFWHNDFPCLGTPPSRPAFSSLHGHLH